MAEEAVVTIIGSDIAPVITAVVAAIGAFLIQEIRWRKEFKTEFMAERAVRKLLMHKKWKQRSFEEIEKKLGGFEPEELRKLLVRSGAVRFYGSVADKEFWGLISRNKDAL